MQNTKCEILGENKKMGDVVFKMRRDAMRFIYEARKVLGNKFERITIRVTDNGKGKNKNICGAGRLGKNIIWIPDNYFDFPDIKKRWIVFHEIGHAIFSAEHDKSHLMQRCVPDETTIEKQNNGLAKLSK